MPFFEIQNFKFGLDSRRSELTTQPGALETLQNAHINQGGEIEKRRAFVDLGALPVNTFGLEVTSGGPIVFGSITTPIGLPTNVVYQQCEHPYVYGGGTYVAGVHAMTSVLCSTSFGGSAWVAAKFADGNVFAFYNGVPIAAFYNGQVLASGVATPQTKLEIAQQLATYIATITGLYVGPVTNSGSSYYFDMWSDAGLSYAPTVDVTSVAGTLKATNISSFTAGVTGTAATSSFMVVGGSYNTSKTSAVPTGAAYSGATLGVYTLTGLVNGMQYYWQPGTADSKLVMTGTGAVTLSVAGTFVFVTGNTVTLQGQTSATVTAGVYMSSGITSIQIYDAGAWVEVMNPTGATPVYFSLLDSLATFANNVAAQIDTVSSALNVSALTTNNTVRLSFDVSTGTASNGDNVKITAVGDCCIDNTVLVFSGVSGGITCTQLLASTPTNLIPNGAVYATGVYVLSSHITMTNGAWYYWSPGSNDQSLVVTVANPITLTQAGFFQFATTSVVTLNGSGTLGVNGSVLAMVDILGATVTAAGVAGPFVAAIAAQIRKYSTLYTAYNLNSSLIISRRVVDSSAFVANQVIVTTTATVVDGSGVNQQTVAPIGLTITPNPATQYKPGGTGTVFSVPVAAVVTQGTAPFNFSWKWLSGTTTGVNNRAVIAISVPANTLFANQVTFSLTNNYYLYAGQSASAVYQCTVTDSYGLTTAATVEVLLGGY